MPKWIHARAEHILAKNPSMPKSEAFAIATQQGHATGHTPKGFGTAAGKKTAKGKFGTPKGDEQQANPGSLTSPKLAMVANAVGVLMESFGLFSKLGFASSAYGGQPAQNGPGMRGKSQTPAFTAPPLEVKQAAKLPKGLTTFVKNVKGQGGRLHEAAARHAQHANGISDALAAVGDLGKTIDFPPVRGGWVHPTKALQTSARRHARAAHMSDVLAGVADKDTRKARLTLAAGLGGVGTAAAGVAVHGRKEAGAGVGAGMSASQYSGPLSYGPFKQESAIPAFISPGMTKTDPRLEAPAYATGGDKTAGAATGAMSAAGRLQSSQRLTAPKLTGFAGPSIAEIAKPKGFGKPLSGALKGTL